MTERFEIDNEANHIKWLLNELILDLASAVKMGREAIQTHNKAQLNIYDIMGRLRVCNHSIILSLFKAHEIRIKYSRFLSTLPPSKTEDFIKTAAQIDNNGICKFRNKHAAHIIDKETKKPVSLAKGTELLEKITGHENSKLIEFYDWISPVDWSEEKPCIITTLHRLREYCKSLPGGDLERP